MDLTLPHLLLRQVVTTMGCSFGCLRKSVTVEGVRYKVIKQIAEGGFSTIDLVEESNTGKRFAMKRITCHSIEDQNDALREVETIRKFHHPNIVRVVGSSTWGQADILHNTTSEVVVVFPLYKQST